MADIFGGSSRYANRGTSRTYKKPSSSGSSKSSGSSSSSKISSSSSSKSSSGSSSSRGSSSSSSRGSSSGGSSSGVKYNSAGERLYSDGYGGYTTTPSTSQKYAQTYGGSNKTVSSGGSSATKPTSGGSSGGSSSGSSVQYSSGGSSSSGYNAGVDYHQQAIDAAARGDWAAVAKALAARQAKINAQGGNDRGQSNAQIFANLQNQYKASYNALSNSAKNTVSGMATGSLNGQSVNGRGWEDGHDYLSEAQALAKAGDLDAAYDALTRRGFKMYDTGSAGGGTTQDQAYAAVRQLYNESVNARNNYLNEVARNAERLAAHPTQFGNVQNAALANKHFVSQDGQYIIYYDSTGTPVKAQPNNGQYGSTKYSPEYIELMRQYYGGDASTDYASLQRQMHNLDVVYSGNGRLVNNDGSYASGSPIGTTDWYNWDPSTIPGTELNVNQDRAALQDILNRINAGQIYDSPLTVSQAVKNTLDYSGLPGTQSGDVGSYSGYGEEIPSGGTTGAPFSGLSDFLRQMYAQNLEAQLAGLRSTYERNRADIQAQDDLLSRLYQQQRNQAAAQNDIQRMQMAEFGLGQGLNTGTAGQLALAQSAVYQGNLADIGSAEAQSLAESALQLQKLTSAYRGDVDQAAAESGAALAQALYKEYVRQINAEEDARAAALAQSNWERQFAYQQAQDTLAQQNWQAQFDYAQAQDAADLEYQMQKLLADQEATQYESEYDAYQDAVKNASNWAKLMFQNGVMPDAATLELIGLDAGTAQSLANAYRNQLASKYKSSSSSSRSSKSTGSSKSSAGGGEKTVNNSQDIKRGTAYASALKQAMLQKSAGISAEQIADYLDQYDENQLTPFELDYIMTQVTRR